MKKEIYEINIPYAFDPAHAGAPYTLNGGESWINHGDLCEILFKACRGFEAKKDACGSYDKTDDVPELNASIKSAKATLVNKKLGYDFDSFKAHYFATCHSNLWIWVSIKDEVLTAYHMNRHEFESFMDNWANFTNDRKVIRFKADSLKLLQWLEERAN